MFISLLFCLSGHNLWNWFVNDLSLFLVFFSSPVSPAVPHTLSAHAYIGLLIVHYSFFLLSCQMPAGVLWISFITACFGLLLCWWQCFYPALARSGEISHIVSPFHLCILFLLHNVLNSFSFCSLSIFSTLFVLKFLVFLLKMKNALLFTFFSYVHCVPSFWSTALTSELFISLYSSSFFPDRSWPHHQRKVGWRRFGLLPFDLAH